MIETQTLIEKKKPRIVSVTFLPSLILGTTASDLRDSGG
jgi:hypothetical protein